MLKGAENQGLLIQNWCAFDPQGCSSMSSLYLLRCLVPPGSVIRRCCGGEGFQMSERLRTRKVADRNCKSLAIFNSQHLDRNTLCLQGQEEIGPTLSSL